MTTNITTHLLAPSAIPSFLLAGNALLTVLNTRTQSRHTFKITAPGKTAQARDEAPLLFVSALTGPDNTASYSYIGVYIRSTGEFRTTVKSRLGNDDPKVLCFAWLSRNAGNMADHAHVEVRHHNLCCRCGRVLTVPASIDTGLGPECAKTMGKLWAVKTA